VYDRDYQLVATIPDTVELDGTEYSGAPVEAVPTSDGRYVYVSNYQMYGPGYGRAGGDGCNLADWDESFVYRIDTDGLSIDQTIEVGAVPKFLAITPDDSTVLVSNWCSFDMSIIDTATATETARVELGRHPRGIAVTADGGTAYVAVMGSTNIAAVDLNTLEVEWIRGVGAILATLCSIRPVDTCTQLSTARAG
jgi:YVTN family beta-propeller protein